MNQAIFSNTDPDKQHCSRRFVFGMLVLAIFVLAGTWSIGMLARLSFELEPGTFHASDRFTKANAPWAVQKVSAITGVPFERLFLDYEQVFVKAPSDVRTYWRIAWWNRSCPGLHVDADGRSYKEILNQLSQISATQNRVSHLSLQFNRCETFPDLGKLREMKWIRSLAILGGTRRSFPGASLTWPPNVKDLMLCDVLFDENSATSLTTIGELESLWVEACDGMEHVYRVLPRLKRLRCLDLYPTRDESFVPIVMKLKLELDSLQTLRIDGDDLSLTNYLRLSERIPSVVALLRSNSYVEHQQNRCQFGLPSGFLGDTHVVTNEGPIGISRVSVGTSVACRSLIEESAEVRFAKTVISRSVGPFSAPIDLEGIPIDPLEDNSLFRFTFGRSSLTTTLIQPLYVEGRGWVEAHEVKVGDQLRGKDGPTPEITAIERVPPESTYVIRTEGNLPYFVSPPGADFTIWVP